MIRKLNLSAKHYTIRCCQHWLQPFILFLPAPFSIYALRYYTFIPSVIKRTKRPIDYSLQYIILFISIHAVVFNLNFGFTHTQRINTVKCLKIMFVSIPLRYSLLFIYLIKSKRSSSLSLNPIQK